MFIVIIIIIIRVNRVLGINYNKTLVIPTLLINTMIIAIVVVRIVIIVFAY